MSESLTAAHVTAICRAAVPVPIGRREAVRQVAEVIANAERTERARLVEIATIPLGLRADEMAPLTSR